MEIFSGSSGSLGNGKLCGKNTGQHLYIPVENDQARPLIRIIADGRLRLDASADLPSFDVFKGVHKLRTRVRGRGYLLKCKFVGTCQNSLEQNLAGAVLTNFCTLKEWTLGRVFKLCVSTFFIQICLRNQLNF